MKTITLFYADVYKHFMSVRDTIMAGWKTSKIYRCVELREVDDSSEPITVKTLITWVDGEAMVRKEPIPPRDII